MANQFTVFDAEKALQAILIVLEREETFQWQKYMITKVVHAALGLRFSTDSANRGDHSAPVAFVKPFADSELCLDCRVQCNSREAECNHHYSSTKSCSLRETMATQNQEALK